MLKFTNNIEIPCGAIYGVAKNYLKHAREMGGEIPASPSIFIKPPSSYVAPGGVIEAPDYSHNIHYEVELVVAIGKDCRKIRREQAIDYIAGYAVGIDVTLRDLQHEAKDAGLPWGICKGFYSSAPTSEFVSVESFTGEIPNFDLLLELNGELRQSGNTSDLIRPVDELIEFLSKVFLLKRGDLIFTGTPEGIGQIKRGDKLHAELKGYAAVDIEVV